jgi:hypothetical protein
MNNKITELLNKPDNIEAIRDTVAAILKIECAAQYEIAKELTIEKPNEFRIGVWKENSRPWQLTEDAEHQNPFPLVNISILGFHEDTPGGPAIGPKKYIGEIILDCYAHGTFDSPEQSDAADAAIKAWKVARIVRNIIASEQYSYLGMRGIVREHKITEGRTGSASNIDEAALAVIICRLVLTVAYFEDNPKVETVQFEGMSFTASTPGGEVLINI